MMNSKDKNHKKATMKIMVGMGSVDDYPSYVEAGAGEIFVGYVPHSWVKKYGTRVPLNRREVLYYNVQIGSYSELQILRKMMDHYQVPVTITMNSLSYPDESYDDIWEIIKACTNLGFMRFIVADRKLISYLTEQIEEEKYTEIELIVSGEYGELNEGILEDFAEKGIRRVIFPRQTTLGEMKELAFQFPQMEYEAFALNEKCHFTGAYCNSMHCDEMCHMCKVEYRYSGEVRKRSYDDNKGSHEAHPETNYENLSEGNLPETVPGFSGCGLCALWELRAAGVTYLKLVSRGNASEDTVKDIRILKKAVEILEHAESKKAYVKTMKAGIFPEGCSKNCYYL